MVANPPTGTTAQGFRVSIVDNKEVYKLIDNNFVGAITTGTAPTHNIPIQSVSITNHELFANSVEYTFQFYFDTTKTTLDANEYISVMFPMEYDLYLIDGKDYTCNTQLIKKIGAPDNWNTSNDSCKTNKDNTVKLPAAKKIFEATDKFVWNIQGISNPEYAQQRDSSSSGNWDWDESKANLGLKHDKWTNKFVIHAYDTSLKNITAKSYKNLNHAYVGLDYDYLQLSVNGYTA